MSMVITGEKVWLCPVKSSYKSAGEAVRLCRICGTTVTGPTIIGRDAGMLLVALSQFRTTLSLVSITPCRGGSWKCRLCRVLQ